MSWEDNLPDIIIAIVIEIFYLFILTCHYIVLHETAEYAKK